MSRVVWSSSFLAALLGIYVACPFRLGVVCGSSMEPTYHNGQPILVDQGYYRRHPIQHGDVILLHVQGETLIKRVFACSGDSFHLWISPDAGEIHRFVVADDLLPRLRRAFRCFPGNRVSRVTVLPGYVYVLGDNSNVS